MIVWFFSYYIFIKFYFMNVWFWVFLFGVKDELGKSSFDVVYDDRSKMYFMCGLCILLLNLYVLMDDYIFKMG